MTKKEAIESIKAATKAISSLFYVEDAKFEAVKVKDGSQDVSIEGEYAKGSKVNVSSATGSTPAPDGNWTLSDKKKFATKGGMISEIMDDDTDDDSDSDEDFSKEAEAPAEVAEKAEASAEAEAPKESVIEKIEDAINEVPVIVKEVEGLVEEIKNLKSEFEAFKAAFATKEDLKALGTNFTAIKAAFDVLSDTPAEFSKVDQSVLAKEDKAKKLEALAGLMKK